MLNSKKKGGSILAISYSFPPIQGSGSIRNYNLLKFIPSFNWELHILTIKEKYSNSNSGVKLTKDVPDTVNILRTNCFYIHDFIIKIKQKLLKVEDNYLENIHSEIRNNNQRTKSKFKNKLKDFITDLISTPDKYIGWAPYAFFAGCKVINKNKIDIIYAVGKPWTSFFVGYTLKILYRKPLVIDFMDPWMTSSWRKSKGFILDTVNTYLEKFIVKRADFIIANTNELSIDFINRLKVPKNKISVITCGFNENDFVNFNRNLKKNKNDKFVITHLGSFYNRRSPLNFLKAVFEILENNCVHKNNLRIRFIGNFDSFAANDKELIEFISKPLLSEVLSSVNWVTHSEAIKYLFSSGLLLLIQPDAEYQIPAKLYEYVYTKKPILSIGMKYGAMYNIIKKEEWGKTIENNDIQGIANTICSFYSEHLNHSLKNIVDDEKLSKYNYKNLARKLSIIFENVKST